MLTSDQKTALITGCSEPGGLGAALALNLKSKGYRVFATARKLETLKGLAGEDCDVLELDVQDMDSIKSAAKEVETIAGRLDLLINNAGVSEIAPLMDTDIERAKIMMDINHFGPIRMVQGFGSLLVRTANDPMIAGRSGKASSVGIINIGSQARFGMPWNTAYSGSKAALEAVSHSMRYEFAPLNVKVAYVHLGGVQTPGLHRQRPFQLMNSNDSCLYPNWDEIKGGTGKELAKLQERSPQAAEAAATILGYHYAGKYPSEGWFAGDSAWIAQYLFPLLPRSIKDKFFIQYGRSDLIRPPQVS